MKKIRKLKLNDANEFRHFELTDEEKKQILGGTSGSGDDGTPVTVECSSGSGGGCKPGCKPGCQTGNSKGTGCGEGCSPGCKDGCQPGCKTGNKEGSGGAGTSSGTDSLFVLY